MKLWMRYPLPKLDSGRYDEIRPWWIWHRDKIAIHNDDAQLQFSAAGITIRSPHLAVAIEFKVRSRRDQHRWFKEVLAKADEVYPVFTPPILCGQVWRLPDGREEPVGELTAEKANEKATDRFQGAVLISGPLAPWVFEGWIPDACMGSHLGINKPNPRGTGACVCCGASGLELVGTKSKWLLPVHQRADL